MGADETSSSKCVNVSGTMIPVPDTLFTYLKELPRAPRSSGNENDGESKNDGMVTLHADPSAFHWLVYYFKHDQSLHHSFWDKEEDVESLQALAVSLGMTDLVLYIGNHSKPKDGFLKTNMKRSSSWQKRARERSKRKLDALAASIRGSGGIKSGGIIIVRKLKSPSYKELQSQHVM